MKTVIILLSMIIASGVSAQNYSILCKEAAEAYKAGKYTLALEKYKAARKAAATAAQKYRIIPAQITIYQKMKKYPELDKFLEQERQDDSYNNIQMRYLLNRSAGIHIWPRRDMRYAMVLLTMARLLQVPQTDNTYYNTYFLLGEIFRRNGQYDYIIYYLSPLPEIKNFHPSNSYNISMMIARAYRAKGDKKMALKWSRKALESGKKVPYKYNYSEAQRFIKELSK